MAKFLFCVTFLIFLRISLNEARQRCMAALTPEFDHCDHLRDAGHDPNHCPQNLVCKKRFTFSDIQIEPVHILENIVVNALELCCGNLKCRQASYYENQTIPLKDVTPTTLSKSSFIFPVLGEHTTDKVFGFHYIPILELSSGFLITKETTPAEVLLRLITSCANLWPLLVIILLLSMIAGFVIWIPETWFNKEEFPRMFFRGVFEGSWWAFVSMTTVGYGDKTPKFILSRIWSVIWILVGITICSIFTASLTNEITAASNEPDPTMHGKTIGVFKYRSFDAAFVVKHGGKILETNGTSESDNIRELKNMLASGTVDGIFMDKYTYMHAVSFARGAKDTHAHHHGNSESAESDADFFLKETHRTKVTFEGEKMAYGVVVKEEVDYVFFEEFIRHNQIVYETCALLHINEADDAAHEAHDIFSTEDEDALFYDFLYVCVGIIAGILVVGIVFEIVRWLRKKKKVDDSP